MPETRTAPKQLSEQSRRFAQFVMMQLQNIYFTLGLLQEPGGRPMQPDLEAARMLIDQLEMISEKTRGNLSEEEHTIIESAIQKVRFAYVEVAGIGTLPEREPAPAPPSAPAPSAAPSEKAPAAATPAPPSDPVAAAEPSAPAPEIEEEPPAGKRFIKKYN